MDFRNCSHGVNSAEYMRYKKMNIAARSSSHTFRHRPGRIAELRALWEKLAPVRNGVAKRAQSGSILTGKFNRTPNRVGVGVCKAGQY